jgi:hypothetical protein
VQKFADKRHILAHVCSSVSVARALNKFSQFSSTLISCFRHSKNDKSARQLIKLDFNASNVSLSYSLINKLMSKLRVFVFANRLST